MIKCYLGLGSNQKCPERQIRKAFQAFKNLQSTAILKSSKLYWSKAWGLKTQQDFCNIIIEIVTLLTPNQLLYQCQEIENRQGRIRKKHWGPRTIDIDIIFYGTRLIKTNNLTIPHPYCTLRDFVMVPLLEINPNFRVPNH